VNEAPFEAAWSRLAYHGGNLGVARRLFPGAPEPWIDLSTGINPVPYPLPPLAGDLWARLPETDHLAALEAAAARQYGVSAGETIAGQPSDRPIAGAARPRRARRHSRLQLRRT